MKDDDSPTLLGRGLCESLGLCLFARPHVSAQREKIPVLETIKSANQNGGLYKAGYGEIEKDSDGTIRKWTFERYLEKRWEITHQDARVGEHVRLSVRFDFWHGGHHVHDFKKKYFSDWDSWVFTAFYRSNEKSGTRWDSPHAKPPPLFFLHVGGG